MRTKNPEIMERIIEYVEEYYAEHHGTPSTTMIADRIGIARGTAYKYLDEMKHKGMIDYDGRNIITGRMSKYVFGNNTAAIVGSIACGQLNTAEQLIEEYVPLPESLFGKGEFFILTARGESMIGAGIDPDDLVIIKKQSTANNGDIVVALVDDEATLKRFYKEENRIRLHPENDSMEDIYVDHCQIQGVAVKVIKNL